MGAGGDGVAMARVALAGLNRSCTPHPATLPEQICLDMCLVGACLNTRSKAQRLRPTWTPATLLPFATVESAPTHSQASLRPSRAHTTTRHPVVVALSAAGARLGGTFLKQRNHLHLPRHSLSFSCWLCHACRALNRLSLRGLGSCPQEATAPRSEAWAQAGP